MSLESTHVCQAHWQAVRYPPEPEKEVNFEWDDFVRFRELCNINITEVWAPSSSVAAVVRRVS